MARPSKQYQAEKRRAGNPSESPAQTSPGRTVLFSTIFASIAPRGVRPVASDATQQLDPDGPSLVAVVLCIHTRTIRKGVPGTKNQPALPGFLLCSHITNFQKRRERDCPRPSSAASTPHCRSLLIGWRERRSLQRNCDNFTIFRVRKDRQQTKESARLGHGATIQ